MIVLDLNKDFDRVIHRRLINKANYYGIIEVPYCPRFKTASPIQTQVAVIDGDASEFRSVSSVAPQVTGLSPMMF